MLMRRTIWPILQLLLALSPAQAVAAEATGDAGAAAAWRWSNVARVVAVGDVHGAYDEFVALLRETRIIDAGSTWAAGTTHLVSLGDVLDRGPKSRQVLDLLMRLQAEAERAGGAVHVVLGNHELMNLTGDWRYVTPDDYAAFAADETEQMRAAAFDRFRTGAAAGQTLDAARTGFDARYPAGYFARQAAFGADGVYGRWLVEQPIVIVVNDFAFVHGGLPEALDDNSAAELNRRFRRDLDELLALRAQLVAAGYDADAVAELADGASPVAGAATRQEELRGLARRFTAQSAAPLFSTAGPLWYRGTALCHDLIEQSRIERGLAALAANAVVIGHTPTAGRRAQQRQGGKVVMLDTGMLASYYHGRATALVIEAGRVDVAYSDRDGVAALEDADHIGRGAWSREALEMFLAQAPITESRRVEHDGRSELALQLRDTQRSAPATFVPGNARQNAAEIAAYRLDALLGLDLVPVTVGRVVDGAAGVVVSAPDRVITEDERRRKQLARPNWCGAGNDYPLMYVFDALIGNWERAASDVSYDRASWQLQLTGNARAFPTTRTVPRPSHDTGAVVPPALAERLAALDIDGLRGALGNLLSTRQLDALLARRDVILKTWKPTG
jgi:Calcineurin-like phosphoesterase